MGANAVQFSQHVEAMQLRCRDILHALEFDNLLIHSGHPLRIFFNDQDYPFKVNPYFKQWAPLIPHPHCWLVIDGCHKPRLIVHQPSDALWDSVIDLPEGEWQQAFDIEFLASPTQIEAYLPISPDKSVYLGPHPDIAKALGISQVNPDRLLNFLDFQRGVKTPYEQFCIGEANSLALRGHQAAKEAFFSGASELEVYLAYTKAVGYEQRGGQTKVAVNEHAGLPRYSQLSNLALPEKKRNSMLIHMGAEVSGYIADISRTYVYRKGVFAEMIAEVERIASTLVDAIHVDHRFTDLQFMLHHQIGKLLVDFGLVDCSATACVELGITAFLTPGSVGHHLGLQLHDVGGLMNDTSGSATAPPLEYPELRATRIFRPDQVITIKPAIYWNFGSLKALACSDMSHLIQWEKVDELRRFGGIQVADAYLVTACGAKPISGG